MKFRISETKSQRPLLMTIKWTSIKMYYVIHSMKAKKSSKKCGAHSEVLFCLLKLLPVSLYFLVSFVNVVLARAR